MSSIRLARRSGRRTKDERDALEQLVIAATLELFAEGGSEAVSIRRLAAKVGVPPMSLYRYFPSKTHLLRHLWQDIVGRACARGAAASQAGDAPSRLRAFVQEYLRYWLDCREHYHVVFAPAPPPAQEDDEIPRPDLHPVREALRELTIADLPRSVESDRVDGLVDEIHWLVMGFLHCVLGIHCLTLSEALDQEQRLLDCVDAAVQRARARPARARAAPRLTVT